METLDQLDFNRLETKPRCYLQIALVKLAMGENSSSEDHFKWIEENREKISNIIDAPENEEIRNLAREGRYDEAAVRVRNLL